VPRLVHAQTYNLALCTTNRFEHFSDNNNKRDSTHTHTHTD
jgi:hypothetical protein